MHIDPKSAKIHCFLDCLFALLESLSLKAARKHVGEIDLWELDVMWEKLRPCYFEFQFKRNTINLEVKRDKPTIEMNICG